MDPRAADELPRRLAAGDENAFAALYDRYAARLYRTAVGMLGRREDAEDAVQEVFIAMVRSREKLAEVRDLTAYVFAALRRAAGRCAAGRARQPQALQTAAEAAASNAAGQDAPPVADGLRGERLRRALAGLPGEQREVIALKIDGGLTFAQVAGVLGIPANTAASRYRYALDKLRARLGEDPER